MCTIFIYAIVTCLSTCGAFNLDIEHPVIFTGPNGSYFGYTVAMLDNFNGSWVLIGAPIDQDIFQPEVERPGALYKCRYRNEETKEQCTPVQVDNTGNTEQSMVFHGRSIKFHHHKDGQWLGVALDVRPDDQSSVLVCAHRWKDNFLLKKFDDISHMNGMCYELHSNLTAAGRLVPALTKLNRLVNRRLRYAEFSMGSLGMAAQFSDEGGQLLMGAPGLNDWSGGVAIEKESDSRRDLRYIEPVHSIYHDNYIGYAITTGSYLSRRSKNIALGAPKANNTGKVFIFDLANPKDSPQITITGSQMGSYFGSALCTMKLSSDRWDDILVGAPWYSTNGSQEGRVFIYVSRGLMGFQKSDTELTGSSSRNAGFGSTIINLGDINNDGFHDVAVGAPYEADSRGAVYVYLGTRDGVWPVPVQTVHAHTLDPGLRGFGGAFSRPHDIDKNGFNDIVVGAHISNQAVLLRTRPMLNLAVVFIVAPKKIDPGRKCTNYGLPYPCARVRFCFSYQVIGKPVPDEIDLRYTLDVDVTRGRRTNRAVFIESLKNATLTEMTSLSGSFVLSKNSQTCSELQTFFLKSTKDPYEDITVELRFSDSYRNTSSILPISAPYAAKDKVYPAQQYIRRKISIMKDCGPDDICKSSLDLLKTTVMIGRSNSTYIVDVSNDVRVNISLINRGEIAYATTLKLVVPWNLALRAGWRTMANTNTLLDCKIRQIRTNSETRDIICNIGDVKFLDDVIGVSIQFAIRSEFSTESFNIISSIQTRSSDTVVDRKTTVSEVKVQYLPSVKVTGFSTPDQRVMSERHDFRGYENVTHIYDVTSFGPSSLSRGIFTVHLPVRESYIDLRRYTIDTEGRVSCEVNRSSTWTAVYKTRDTTIRKKMMINCESFPCVSITCDVWDLSPQQSINLKAYMTVSRRIFTDNTNVKHIRLESSSVFSYDSDLSLNIQIKETGTSISTDFLIYEKVLHTGKLELWIVLVSFCAGIFVFLIIGIILLKIGFFKRKHRDDLLTLRKLQSRHCGRYRNSSEETSDGGDGSNENLVLATDYRTVAYDLSGESSPDSPISRTFGDTDYLEPIQHLSDRD
ncbi:integrin alpha-3-like [Mizuhopecten yessoensis]|uniref:Integrin alpha-9 n=1 Tax=Mizuhopecten yessoensis TaxID=6573 RepID=A0A210QG50_MIZYE|nr:integrin alpha-3-like [Mizuhopecten yessoensis]OWF47715.1 Integrin alpha-9 [Mizuhopecten yessoensis]